MRRRDFIFRSMKASMLLHPVLSIRQAEAQVQKKMKAFFYVDGGSYPLPEDFFPAPTEAMTGMSSILSGFTELASDMVVVSGINIKDSGPNPKGNNHIRSVGKVLTAKDVFGIPGKDDGLPGGISIDQIIAQGLGNGSLEVMVNDGDRNDMRGRPFALGPNQFKPPVANAADAWDRVFSQFQTPAAGAAPTDPAVKAQRMAALKAKKSLMDDLLSEMKRFRVELVGVEKLKLDIHEDAIRKAELSVARDLEIAATEGPTVSAECSVPGRGDSGDVPGRANAHFDILYAAFLCERISVGGMMFGWSSPKWKYEWINLGVSGNIHDQVYHKVGTEREKHIRATQWNFDQLAKFAKRLKATPDGSGNMLDNVLIYGTSYFGRHHKLEQIPLILVGKAQGRLRTGRSIQVGSRPEGHAQILTSTAQLCGVNINGIGDDPQSGPLPELA